MLKSILGLVIELMQERAWIASLFTGVILIRTVANSENTEAILIRTNVGKGTNVILKNTGVVFDGGGVYLRSI